MTKLEYCGPPVVVDFVVEAWELVAVHSFPTTLNFDSSTVNDLENPLR
jgi:hypothetical protein